MLLTKIILHGFEKNNQMCEAVYKIEFEEKFYDFLDASCSDLLSSIKTSGELDEKMEENLKTKINDFIKGF